MGWKEAANLSQIDDLLGKGECFITKDVVQSMVYFH